MSIQAVSWVLDHSTARHGERLVLIAIANHYDFNDPAFVVIAREAHLSRSAVIRAIQNLERAGELIVERDETPGRSRKNHYTIPGYERSRDATYGSGTVASGAETVANAAGNGRVGATRTMSNRLLPEDDAQAEPEREPYSDEFEQWWSGYPRKDDKRGAFNAFKARRRAGVSLGRLIVARINYLNDPKTDHAFLKYGKTFLEHNDGPWSEWEHREPPSIEALIEPASGPSFAADREQSRRVEPRQSTPCPLGDEGCRDGMIVVDDNGVRREAPHECRTMAPA